MVRGLIAAVLCVALQAGALCAPLVHAHLDDHHRHHHGAQRVHVHFSGHERHEAPAGTNAVRADDDPEQITSLQTFVAVAAVAFTEPALPPAPFVVPPAVESTMRQPPEEVRSHGPPTAGLPAPRAPPAPAVLI